MTRTPPLPATAATRDGDRAPPVTHDATRQLAALNRGLSAGSHADHADRGASLAVRRVAPNATFGETRDGVVVAFLERSDTTR